MMNNILGGDKRHCDTIVGVGSHVKGEIICKGPSRISGKIEGEVIGDDLLLIGADAAITGEVTGNIIEIDGEVNGTIRASQKIVLNETARVQGDIQAPSVIVEEGARFNGKSHMPMEQAEIVSNVLELEDVTQSSEKSA